MAKKQAKSLKSQYESARGSFRKKVSIARSKGFDINYNIQKPEKITKSFINRLKKITVKDIQQGVELDDIMVTSYFAGEGIDLRPSRRVYEDVIDEIESEEIWQPIDVYGVPYEVSTDTGELRYKSKSEEEELREFAHEQKRLLEKEGYTEDVMHRIFGAEENEEYDEIEGYRDVETGEVLSKDDPTIFRRTNKGRIIYDRNQKPIVKENYVPISSGALSPDEYETLVEQNLKMQYGGIYSNDRGDEFTSWLDDMINKYDVYYVRDKLAQAEDEGYKLDYDFFYRATEADYNNTINALEAMLASGYANVENMLEMSDVIEATEDGFNIDYKNG